MGKQLTLTGNVSHAEIAYLAYQAWDKDGRPSGRDVQYWLEAEAQLKATRHLLASELRLTRTGTVRLRTTRTASAIGSSTPAPSESAPTGKPALSPDASRHAGAHVSGPAAPRSALNLE